MMALAPFPTTSTLQPNLMMVTEARILTPTAQSFTVEAFRNTTSEHRNQHSQLPPWQLIGLTSESGIVLFTCVQSTLIHGRLYQGLLTRSSDSSPSQETTSTSISSAQFVMAFPALEGLSISDFSTPIHLAPGSEQHDWIEYTLLQKLHIANLTNFKAVLESARVQFPNVKTVYIYSVQDFSLSHYRKLVPSTFPKLKSLEASHLKCMSEAAPVQRYGREPFGLLELVASGDSLSCIDILIERLPFLVRLEFKTIGASTLGGDFQDMQRAGIHTIRLQRYVY